MEKVQKKYKFAVIATDVAIFTVDDNKLKILLIKMKKHPFQGTWAIPGGLIEPNESVDQAAERVLFEKTGVQGVYLDQLATFGDVDRDPFGRVVSVAYFALIPSNLYTIRTTQEYDDIKWFDVDKLPPLAYDHENMAKTALYRLKSRLEYSNIVYGLLPKEFTLTELQQTYEIILGHKLDKRNFRKRLNSIHILEPTGKKKQGEANRPAELFRFVERNPQIVKVL